MSDVEYVTSDSVAPVAGVTTCPKCHKHGYSHESGGRHGGGRNVCRWHDCGLMEDVTADQVPRTWSGAELRALFLEVIAELVSTPESPDQNDLVRRKFRDTARESLRLCADHQVD